MVVSGLVVHLNILLDLQYCYCAAKLKAGNFAVLFWLFKCLLKPYSNATEIQPIVKWIHWHFLSSLKTLVSQHRAMLDPPKHRETKELLLKVEMFAACWSSYKEDRFSKRLILVVPRVLTFLDKSRICFYVQLLAAGLDFTIVIFIFRMTTLICFYFVLLARKSCKGRQPA